jgi:hypothetical protein
LFSSKSSRVSCSFWQEKKVLVITRKSKKKRLSLSFVFGVWRLIGHYDKISKLKEIQN